MMSRAEYDLLIELALIVKGMAAPDDQRSIDRKINALAIIAHFGDEAVVFNAAHADKNTSE
jgi:hypothetical protein